jgi:putative nucleotidyltransferase with HDIG domain
MMRAIRFATQLNFTIDKATFQGIMNNKERITIVSFERIITELNKIIMSPVPSIGFSYLMDSGLIEIIFPEMFQLKGAEYVDGIGHKDNYYHTLQVLDNVAKKSDDLWLRWAAIMHDIGKPRTKRFDPKIGWTFHGHDAVGASMTPKIFRRLKLPLDNKMHYVQSLVRLHLRPISLTNENITDSAIRRLLYEAGDIVDDLMILCEADITTKNPKKMRRFLANYEIVKTKMKEIEEKDHLRNWQPPISGEEIMNAFGIAPSRTVGDIKNAIREAILDGDINNTYEEAYAFMIKKAESLGFSLKN